jgi:hypothetical protein
VVGCCSPPTIRTGTSTRPSRRSRARSGRTFAGRSCARTRSRCTGCRARALPDARDRCDVHCAPLSYDELFPYLSDYWRQYISEAGVRLNGVAHAYPPGVVPPAPSSYSELSERVLRESEPRFVVLNCLTGFENHRNPYFSAAVASAINDWVREEFLDRDSRLRASLVVSSVSTDDAVSEIKRMGEDPRFVQMLLPVRSDLPWGHKNNHPMFLGGTERRVAGWFARLGSRRQSTHAQRFHHDLPRGLPRQPADRPGSGAELRLRRGVRALPRAAGGGGGVRLRMAGAPAVAARQGLEERVARGAVGSSAGRPNTSSSTFGSPPRRPIFPATRWRSVSCWT